MHWVPLEKLFMTEPLVTIITATTCAPEVGKNIQSVADQTYKNIQHLIVVDGKGTLGSYPFHSHVDIIDLPYNTGHSGYNGHRIYAAGTFLAKGDYVCFLDQDNWLEPNHVESLVKTIQEGNNWAYSLRRIATMDGAPICNDDCESLGKWKSVLNDNFVDVNCFFLPKQVALQIAPLWYRRARHPDDQPEVDRIISHVLFNNNLKCDTSGKYTVNYRAGNRTDSVQGEFFLRGNEAMKQKMNGAYPWRKI